MELEQVHGAIGDEGFTRLVAAFYAQVPPDPILGPMYPAADFAGAEARLRGFLIYRCGGSQDYVRERGHPRLRMRHMPFPITPAARDRWLELMDAAFAEAALPEPAEQVLRAFFQGTAEFLVNRA